MSNLVKHFERELKILHDNLDTSENEDNKLVIEDFIPEIRSIIRKFSKQGHSGSSAPYYAAVLSRTIKDTLGYKPLSPMTQEQLDDESQWGNPFDNETRNVQNKRFSALFKNLETGKAHYLDAIIWQGEDENDTFSGTVAGICSSQYIKTPFIPKTFYIDLIRVYITEKEASERDEKNLRWSIDTGASKKFYYEKVKDQKQLDEAFEYYEKGFEKSREL